MKWPFSRSLSAKLKIISDSFLSCSFSLLSIFQICPLPSVLDNIHPSRLHSALTISRKPSQTAQFPLFIRPSSPQQSQGAETSAAQFFEGRGRLSYFSPLHNSWYMMDFLSIFILLVTEMDSHRPHLHCCDSIISCLGMTTGLTTTVLSLHMLSTLWLEFACKTLM